MTQQTHTDLETKMASSLDVVEAFDDFMNAFEGFKEANDERLTQIEKRMTSDVITEEKVSRINKAMDEQKRHLDALVLKNQRPSLGGSVITGPAQMEHKEGFDAYIRSGNDHGLRQLEEKALSIGSDPDGGYLVPQQISAEVGKRLANLSPIRSIATVREVSTAMFKKPFAQTGPAVGWVGESAIRPETATPSLAELQFPTMELYAMPAATSSLLEDSAVDIEMWLAEEVEAAFAEQESAAFINGDGVNKPSGFLTAPTVDEGSWSWGNLGTIATGSDGAFADSDVLIDTVYALKAGYRQNASWVMNRKTQAKLRKLKDADGNYLWQAPATADARARLMGFAVVEAEDMPDIATDETSIAFGDFRRGYLVVDRTGVSVLRDPYSAKPYVMFYTTKRIGGGIQDFDAIKLVKFGAA
ncbi:phage major capsid protein [Pseudahrensia aquimaris]|uniref:Phage major capsid protein n=1 Tax=Pseudahrensia aquimaris TaxID=744461 RepID=A0ABW3FF22_9HYPH